MMEQFLQHHGILGQKWGIRRYQNEDGSLTPAGQKHFKKLREKTEKKDTKWAERNQSKLITKAYKKSKREFNKYLKRDLNKQYADQIRAGRVGKNYINKYNQKLSELMNKNIGDVKSPSGRSVRFVAKRGNVGVYVALADSGYDMRNVKNGVYAGGKVAYRKSNVDFRG